ncbi:MAG: TIGR00295 family protein [Archaeoglobales archaeon]|nr:TIGR00295 family protein [Archaeoglobales archaeon]
MEIPDEVKALWNNYNLPERVRKHCIAVAELALRIAEQIKKNGKELDIESIKFGALLHDIGRAITNDPFQHFIESAKILKNAGFEERIVRIAERHFSAGLSRDDALKLGLEAKDYIPETLEEKIVSFADNLVFGERVVSFEDFLKRIDELSSNEMKWLTEETIKRALKMKEEIEKLSGLKF